MDENGTDGNGTFDYVGAYEAAIKEVVKACGSREAANRMLDELHAHYEKTGAELKRIKRIYGDRPELHSQKKAALLADARFEVHRIIEQHAPHTSYRVHEVFLGTSLATAATILPAALAASTFSTAAAIAAIGSSYYIGFRLLRRWKALAGRHRVAAYAGMASPRHVNAREKVDAWLSKPGLF
ncbi:Uncharacterised protein [uncultured archaeon]|nr:Uncharacterised protein [uncultured archaeon]